MVSRPSGKLEPLLSLTTPLWDQSLERLPSDNKSKHFSRTATPIAKTKQEPYQILFDRPAADQNVGKREKAPGASLGPQETKRIRL